LCHDNDSPTLGQQPGHPPAKPLLKALALDAGTALSLELSPEQDAIVLRPVRKKSPVRGRHRIEDLAAAMPKNYKSAEFGWDAAGREVW
jgi:antitoxin component of MazEF toxin-antitoxin module